jgi:hypothetical protein
VVLRISSRVRRTTTSSKGRSAGRTSASRRDRPTDDRPGVAVATSQAGSAIARPSGRRRRRPIARWSLDGCHSQIGQDVRVSRRRAVRILLCLTLVGAAVGTGFVLGLGHAGALGTTPPIKTSYYDGVAVGVNSDGEYCIDNSSEGVRCAVPRLDAGYRLPPAGAPVRARYARLPSDTSYPPEPSWLWVTELACSGSGAKAEEASRCR